MSLRPFLTTFEGYLLLDSRSSPQEEMNALIPALVNYGCIKASRMMEFHDLYREHACLAPAATELLPLADRYKNYHMEVLLAASANSKFGMPKRLR